MTKKIKFNNFSFKKKFFPFTPKIKIKNEEYIFDNIIDFQEYVTTKNNIDFNYAINGEILSLYQDLPNFVINIKITSFINYYGKIQYGSKVLYYSPIAYTIPVIDNNFSLPKLYSYDEEINLIFLDKENTIICPERITFFAKEEKFIVQGEIDKIEFFPVFKMIVVDSQLQMINDNEYINEFTMVHNVSNDD